MGGNLLDCHTTAGTQPEAGLCGTHVVMTAVDVVLKTTRAFIEHVKQSNAFASFEILGSEDVIREREGDGAFDDGVFGDGEGGAHIPDRHTSLKQLVANLGICGETTHPI